MRIIIIKNINESTMILVIIRQFGTSVREFKHQNYFWRYEK